MGDIAVVVEAAIAHRNPDHAHHRTKVHVPVSCDGWTVPDPLRPSRPPA
jgi:hypothetical protein